MSPPAELAACSTTSTSAPAPLDDTDALLALLLSALSSLESGVASGAGIDDALSHASSAAAKAIDGLVAPDDRQAWRAVLKDASIMRCTGCPNASADVACIRGEDCPARYCSARCRRSHARRHRPECEVVKRQEVLKRVGLAAPEELF